MDDTNVIKLEELKVCNGNVLDIDTVLENTKGLIDSDLVILGIDKNRMIYVAGTSSTMSETLLIMEMAKRELINSYVEESGYDD